MKVNALNGMLFDQLEVHQHNELFFLGGGHSQPCPNPHSLIDCFLWIYTNDYITLIKCQTTLCFLYLRLWKGHTVDIIQYLSYHTFKAKDGFYKLSVVKSEAGVFSLIYIHKRQLLYSFLFSTPAIRLLNASFE